MAAIKLCRDHFKVHEDLLVIGGDTLFLNDFSLRDTLRRFLDGPRAHRPGSSMLLAYATNDAGTNKAGILEVDQNNEVCL